MSAVEEILNQAEQLEKEYEWLRAAELYDEAMKLLPENDFLRIGQICERLGYAFYRAAMQAETRDVFKERMKSAAEAYEKTAELFNNVEGFEKLVKSGSYKAMALYVDSRLVADLSTKRKQLDECLRLAKEALKVCEKAADYSIEGKICNNLMFFLFDRLTIEWDAESREKIIEEALKCGERAIEVFSNTGYKKQLAQAYIITATFYRNAAFARGFKVEKREEYRKKALSYPEKALEISEQVGDAYLVGASSFCLADIHLDIMGSTGIQERHHFEKALECGILAKDNRLIADALWGLEFAMIFSAQAQEDPDKAREEYRKLDEYRENAVAHYDIIAHDAGIAYAYSYGAAEQRIATETDLESKRLLIDAFVKLAYKGLEHARLSGSMGRVYHQATILSLALIWQVRVETDTSRKRTLLEESSRYTEESINILKQASACGDVEPREGNLAGCIYLLALNQTELAHMEERIEEKIKMLKNAIGNMQSASEDWLKWARSPWASVDKPQWFMFGRNVMIIGKALSELYLYTNDVNVLGDAIEAFEESIESYGKADSPFSRVAEAYWELAKVYDKMENYTDSAKNFELASENYIFASQKIPQLKDFYQSHSTYMQAWSEIEKARHHHAERQYGKAKEHYEQAAYFYKLTTQWNYLSPNYLAWTKLEEGEDLSRREQTEEAKGLFQEAVRMFAEAKKSIQVASEKIEIKDEKEMLVSLAKASDIRREYCLGRIALEEAKILDRQGNHAASSRSYGFAAEKFQKAADTMENETDRQELKPIIYLCHAWQTMTHAEADASPDLYNKASSLFEEAKNISLDEKAKMLALGHSRFCKALEAGTRFEDIRDTSLHASATKHLESAASYYLKAGFKDAAEYAEATQKLLDAYLYMHNAKIEIDPDKKTRFYIMAEKVLQTSAGSYLKANHPEKQEQVSRLLEKVKKERELALSLTDILHAPITTSSTATFTTPAQTEEKPIGLERFEHADIQANLIIPRKELKIGESLNLEMELVNAGKGAAILIKVSEAIPEGFELIEKPEIYRVEDSYINMKGKRLGPLKAEELRLVLKPKVQGTFHLKPTILYLDENGKYKSHEPEPVVITVKELGITGWLKGER